MDVVIFDIWMSVSDYYTNPTVIILVGIGIVMKCMFYLFIDMRVSVSYYNTNPTVIILVGIGILTKCMFYLLISG
jgi:hypothetical protein